jgi:hypothetical protein
MASAEEEAVVAEEGGEAGILEDAVLRLAVVPCRESATRRREGAEEGVAEAEVCHTNDGASQDGADDDDEVVVCNFGMDDDPDKNRGGGAA